jgi:pentatricopeptide repeat protein
VLDTLEPFTVDDISEERTRRVPEEHYSVLVAPQSTQPGVTMSWQTNSKFNLATSSGDEASSYLEEIAHKQISFLSSPDPITHQYDLSFAALGNNRAPFSEAKKLYSALKAEGVQPSQHIIQRMFAMASSSINDFAWVAKEFENVQISDSIHIASAKIRFFTKVDSEPSRVISTFNAFRASTTCPPQAISCLYNVVIDSLRRMKYFDDAVALWNERRQRGLPIVNYSYEILNAIYIDTENIEKILSLYREMRAEGWIVSRWMTTIITTTLLNCGRLRDTKWVLEDTIRISGYGHTGSLLGAHLSYLSVTDDLQGYKDLLEVRFFLANSCHVGRTRNINTF